MNRLLLSALLLSACSKPTMPQGTDASVITGGSADPPPIVSLADPLPLTTHAAVSKLVFSISRSLASSVTTIQSGIVARNRTSMNALTGMFQLDERGLLKFIPAQPFDMNSEFEIEAPYMRRTAFATASRPRVRAVRLASKDGGKTITYVDGDISEPVDATTTANKLVVRVNDAPATGAVEPEPPYPLVGHFQFDFKPPIPIDSRVTVTLRAGIATTAKVPLDPKSWDSATANAAGEFELAIQTSSMSSCGNGCWTWVPEVN